MRSVIRAYRVEPLHRSAQYIPAIDYVADEILNAPQGKQQQDAMSELGLSHAPAAWSHGGVICRGEIRREAALNLVAVRALNVAAGEGEDQQEVNTRRLNLRRYILGLALVCFTAPPESFLREGCQLVPDPDKQAEWKLVQHDGTRTDHSISHQQVLELASAAAEAFDVGEDRSGTFEGAAARAALGQTGDERRAARRRGRSAAAAQEPEVTKQ